MHAVSAGPFLVFPRYAVFDGIRAVFSSGFLLFFRFLKLDQPWLHHDILYGHEPYAQAIQKLGRHDLGGQLQRRRAAELRASVRVNMRAHHRQLRRGQLGEQRALWDHLAQLDVVLLAAALLARLHRIAVARAAARAPRRAAFLDGATPSPLAISGSGRQSLSCCSIAMRSPWVSCPFLLLGILSTSPRPNAAGTMVSDGIREVNRFFPRLICTERAFRIRIKG